MYRMLGYENNTNSRNGAQGRRTKNTQRLKQHESSDCASSKSMRIMNQIRQHQRQRTMRKSARPNAKATQPTSTFPLVQARLRLKLKQSDVCERVGAELGRREVFSPSWYSKVEHGKGALDALQMLALAKVLQLKPEEVAAAMKQRASAARRAGGANGARAIGGAAGART